MKRIYTQSSKCMKHACIVAFSALTIVCFTSKASFAQKKVRVSEERIEAHCRDLPLSQRTTITVARFNVTTPSTTKEFGANMATMLSNALQEINCFNVLSRSAERNDLEEELTYSKKGVDEQKKLSAQVVVTGEITEYSTNSKGIDIGPFRTGKETLKFGFIVQIKNPETREIYFSKSINVTGKAAGKTEARIWLLKLGGGGSTNPAEANALEQGIKKAVAFVAENRDAIASAVNRSSN